MRATNILLTITKLIKLSCFHPRCHASLVGNGSPILLISCLLLCIENASVSRVSSCPGVLKLDNAPTIVSFTSNALVINSFA